MEIVITGLNMRALNALIRASAIIAKLGVATIIIGAVCWLILIGLSMFGDN